MYLMHKGKYLPVRFVYLLSFAVALFAKAGLYWGTVVRLRIATHTTRRTTMDVSKNADRDRVAFLPCVESMIVGSLKELSQNNLLRKSAKYLPSTLRHVLPAVRDGCLGL